MVQLGIGDGVLVGVDRVALVDLPGVDRLQLQRDTETAEHLLVTFEHAVESVVGLVGVSVDRVAYVVGCHRHRRLEEINEEIQDSLDDVLHRG